MMEAFTIFTEMKNRKLTTSLRSWSQEWLDRAQNFGATHQFKPLPPETAILLRRRLVEAGHHDLAAMVLLAMLNSDEKPRRQTDRA
jgi:hypothetical protein